MKQTFSKEKLVEHMVVSNWTNQKRNTKWPFSQEV